MANSVIGITGGAGYLGSSLAKYLPMSLSVKLLDIKEPKQKFGRNVIFQNCDVTNYEDVTSGLKDVDLVIHTSIIQIPAIIDQKKVGYNVNFVGTQNICRAVEESPTVKGLILSGSWHTIGERGLKGTIDEEFGFRPDKVEDRARLYALSKMAQESIVRFFDEMTTKVFGIIRMGTVLGNGMPEKTAANIFIENGLTGKALTPFKHSLYRPMLYVDLEDICKAYETFATKILSNNVKKDGNSVSHIFNVYYPEVITIIDLAEIVRETIIRQSNGGIQPKIEIVDTGQFSPFAENDKALIKINAAKASDFFEIGKMKSPRDSINEIVEYRIGHCTLG